MFMKFTNWNIKILMLLGSVNIFAQNPGDVLVTINDSIYHVSDFERLYNKNIDIVADESQKDVDTYFELYKLYKLKLQDAYREGYHLTTGFRQEYNTYRTELSEKYFINEKELDKLLKEALERNDYEINASHILFALDQLASPADTLAAYNKALEVRSKLLGGLSFEEAARNYSDDLSAKNNNGNLGYFSVFKMVYPFESGAYETAVGNISMPVRSNYGYHLIKVIDKRPVSGIKSIAHILIETKGISEKEAKKKIDEIYDKLQKGQNFDDLAFHFSEDIYSRDKGGQLGVYTEGTFDIKGLSDIVYGLNYKDAVSRPFLSQYGWHIVRITDIRERPSAADLKDNFLRRIKSDQRSKILEKDLIDHLKDMYRFKVDRENVLKTAGLLKREEMVIDPKVEDTAESQLILATYADKSITAKNVLEHIYSFPQLYTSVKTDELLVQKAFDFYALQMLKRQYNDDLEKNFPDFAHTMAEYGEGLMLFDLLEQKIWKTAANDTLAQQLYYDEHLADYMKPAYFIGEVYVFENRSDANSFQRALNGHYPVREEDFRIVYKYQGTFFTDDKRLPLNLDMKHLGRKTVRYNKKYFVFKVRDLKEAVLPAYGDIKNKVLSDYQNKYEKEYGNRLLENAEIKVNEPVLNQLRTKYNKKSLN